VSVLERDRCPSSWLIVSRSRKAMQIGAYVGWLSSVDENLVRALVFCRLAVW
jgi:hypothetical protein